VESAGTEAGAETVVVDAPLEIVMLFDAVPVQPAAFVTVTL
jgi:hypothetical protein